MRQAAKSLGQAGDTEYSRFRDLAHRIGPALIPPLAETLAGQQDPKARRRIREVLVGFGRRGRDVVQKLLDAPNWEVRRTAAYLMNEFGGMENVSALEPLLSDKEPRVQREALRSVLLSPNEQAYEAVLRALASTSPARASLAEELTTIKDERAAPLLSYLLPRIDRHALRPLFLSSIEALGTFGGTDAVDALKHALHQGDLWSPFKTRAHRVAAADALNRIGSDQAMQVLREAADHGPGGVRRAARAAIGKRGG
jgi:HEAT repeat protein